LWRSGYRYSKAGVMTVDLVPLDKAPRALFDQFDREQSARLMTALDAVNEKFGRNTVFPAATGIKRPWSTKFDRRSPRYTTCVAELPVVKA